LFNLKKVYYPNGEVTIVFFKVPVGKFKGDDDSINEKSKIGEFPLSDEDRNHSINCSLSRTKNKVMQLARSNIWEWFLTLTFNGEKVDRYNYEECTLKLSKWLKNQRMKYPDMAYSVVPEQHKDGAWHFHALVKGGLTFVEAHNPHTGDIILSPSGSKVYNVKEYKWGLTTATRVSNSKKASQYIVKYMTKELVGLTPEKKRYWNSRNCELPFIEKFMIHESLVEQYLENEGYKKKADYVTIVKPSCYPEQEITYYEINNNISYE